VDDSVDRSDAANAVTVHGVDPVPDDPLSFAAGTTMARYVVLEEIGRGGMGHVFRAYDPALQREVALKEVRREVLDRDATQRLIGEARAMAKLSHPNVVAVYDVEELPTGEVVLVMEYVPGGTLRRWLRDDEHAWDEIVPKFIAAGRGLSAAHGAGILHRDFKPANVMVDGETVKVTDFGLAKLVGTATSSESIDVEGELPELTDGKMVMGTPRYMAPEQHRALPLNAAADQFAFCVSLWEALSGSAPYDGRKIAREKLAGPPAWTARHVPRPIVDAIMRGLAPDPRDRWPTMDALLLQLGWDPSQRRNRITVGVGVAATLLVAGVSYDTWAEANAERCQGAEAKLDGIWDDGRRGQVEQALQGVGATYAEDVWARTERALDGYRIAWIETHTDACRATQRGEQSPRMLDLRVACLDRAALELRTTVDVLADADAEVLQRAHTLTGELPSLARCSDTEALAADIEPPAPKDAPAVEEVRAALAHASSLGRAARYDDALGAVERAKRVAERVDYGPVETEVLAREGGALSDLGRYGDAEAVLLEALERAGRWQQWDLMRSVSSKLVNLVGVVQQRTDDALRYLPIERGLAVDTVHEAQWRTNVGNLRLTQGKYVEAETEFHNALRLRLETSGQEHLTTAEARNNLGASLARQGRYDEAEDEFRAALDVRRAILGADHPHVGSSQDNLATILARKGDYARAEVEVRKALEIRAAALGPEHPDVAKSRNNLGNLLEIQGKAEAAEVEHRAALAIRLNALGPEHPAVADSRGNLANALDAQGKLEAAAAEHEAALEIRIARLGEDHPLVASSRNNLGNVLHELGKLPESEAQHRAALASRLESMGKDHPSVAQSRNNLALVLIDLDRLEDAEVELRASLSTQLSVYGVDHPVVADTRHNIARVLHRQERIAEALVIAELAWERRRENDIQPAARGDTASLLAQLLWDAEDGTGDQGRARSLADQALRAFVEAGPAKEDDANRVRRWLDSHGE
jgi:tetratricopeptide (TPR) repeat protein/tRNA A-37 threonylcarbamoyl transferase component Bud32